MKKNSELKLIYVLKIGKNSKGEIMYEFLFSNDPENIEIDMWNWDQSPAIDNKDFTVPTQDYVTETYSLTTKDFVLNCLHDAIDRPYIHGYYLIHALAYEDNESEELDTIDDDIFPDVDDMYNDDLNELPLVFHYGMTLKQVEDALYNKSIILKNKTFINPNSIKI